jgi:hypothetical protein
MLLCWCGRVAQARAAGAGGGREASGVGEAEAGVAGGAFDECGGQDAGLLVVVVVDFGGGLAVTEAQDPAGVLDEAAFEGDRGGEEHAEQAFLATVKLKADGTHVTISREDHDAMHLLGRADRILPNGWCLLPPLQACGKGNACLTCSVFVTDQTHQQALERQLADTGALINRARADFQQRHGRPMPEANVWLAQRQAEHDALTRLLTTMQAAPGRAVQGAGCGTTPAGPVPVTIDTTTHRKDHP